MGLLAPPAVPAPAVPAPAVPAPAAEGPDAARARVDGLLAEGKALSAKRDLAGAYAAFASALGESAEQDGKDQARDALLALPTPPSPPLTEGERALVVARIDEERARYLRDVANRLLGQERLRGALRLLDEVKGSLQEEATARVLGDPKGEERREREVADLRVRIFGDLPPEEKAAVDALREKHRGDPDRLLREGEKLRKDKRQVAARRLLQYLVLDPSAPAPQKDAARLLVEELEKEILADLGPEEKAAVEEALRCPVFGRLQVLPAMEFLYIGDADLLARIPERSRFLLDLAYLAQTDLAGRIPNPDGKRVTIFFKELWDFAGGVGGGSRIDIGRADPKSKQAVVVGSGLYFHELGHCVFVPDPRFPGWMEGIANFAAAFTASFLRLETDAWHSAKGNLDAFLHDYLEREEAYWRTAPYGPTAGWFLHWIEAYGRRLGKGYDWVRYGRVLRAWQGLSPRPESVAGVARAFGALLASEFGPKVWEDLAAQRFPVEEGTAVDLAFPDGEAHYRAHVARSTLLSGAGEPEEAARLRAEAGMLAGWRVCGPFYPPERGDALATVFPPEREAVFDREYPGSRQVARWFAADGTGPVAEDGAGAVTARWAYPEGSATYGLLDVDVPAAVEAFAWVGTEHRWALWVDGRLVEKQEWESGEYVPDRDRVRVPLSKGRHRVLFKAALGWRGPTFAVRLTDLAGKGIEGLRCLPAEERPFAPATKGSFKSYLRDEFQRNSLGSAWTAGPGGFTMRNKVMRGNGQGDGVPWRKYSVRPGFPQDRPANQLTLDPKIVRKGGKEARVEVAMEGNPKVALTLDAEEADGGLTGWTVILDPRGGEADVRLERYDRLMYLATGVPLGKGREHLLSVERRDGFLTVEVDGGVALDRVSAPPLRRDGLRLCTWGADPILKRVEILRAGD